MPSFVKHFTLFLILCSAPGLVLASAKLEQQRADYQAAQVALRAEQMARFKELRAKLDDYPLRAFLDHEAMKDRLGSLSPTVIRNYLNENAEAYVSNQLRRRWLAHLARTQDWTNFFQEYRDVSDDAELRCQRLDRLLKVSKDHSDLLAEIDLLWLNNNELPVACGGVIAAWRKAGRMTNELIWEHIRRAMERRELSYAERLGQHLNQRDQVWVKRWIAMHRNPDRELSNINYPVETPVARLIVRHGVVRMGFNDPGEAMQTWQRLQEKYEFFGEDENYVLRWLGLLAAQRHMPEAVDWLSAVSADDQDATLRQWRVRAALRAGQWRTGLRFLAALTQEEQKESEWRYWKARMLERTDSAKEARELYRELARERSYYGFLSADQVGMDYAMQHVSIEPSPEEVSTLLARPGIQMARELYQIGEINDARRQWAYTTRAMGSRQLQVAAVLARQWGWYDRAILTVGKSDHLDDLEIRFPLLYRDLVEANAQRNSIDPSWVYGVVRQESAFVTDARSSAGALGLMQLMPNTGRQTGRRINLPIPSTNAILNVENNLRLGSSYLKIVLDTFGGNQVLATASYNAGPNRVRIWLPSESKIAADTWIDTIPYNETRNYVKNVLGFTAVYDYRLGVTPTRLQDRMAVILPRDR